MPDELSGEIARGLDRRGLSALARLLLEAHRPLRPLLAETAAFLSPLARPLLGRRFITVTDILDHDAGYDELIDALDRDDAEFR